MPDPTSTNPQPVWAGQSATWHVGPIQHVFINCADDSGEFTIEHTAPAAAPFYLLVCRLCTPGDVVIPFDTAEARGKWAAAHRAATGHDRWWCHDYAPTEESNRG